MYCYKCGVKLSDAERKCPLCKTKMPYHNLGTDKLAYSDKIDDINKHINFRYLSRLILVILCFLGIITFLCNYFINGKITWSIYVLSSIIRGIPPSILIISSSDLYLCELRWPFEYLEADLL